MIIKHKHHIIPKHMGGSDDSSNLIELTIEEHANAHKQLWEKYNKNEDYIAWKMLSGQANIKDFFPLLSNGGKTNKDKKYWFNIETNEIKKSKKCPGTYWIRKRIFKTQIQKFTHNATNSIWCHNPNNTNETKMVKSEIDIPENWIKGRGNNHLNITTNNYKFWHNPISNEITSSFDQPNDGWIQGLPSNLKEKKASHIRKFSQNAKGSKWYHDPLSKKSKMIKPHQSIPTGWIIGRGY